MRDANNQHRLVIDEHAASVVRDIFHWKIEGMSQQKIADRLNEIAEPSPAEYKRRNGKFFTVFQKNERALWSAVTVGRILKNPMYIGTLVQGRRTTPSYKVKKELVKPQDEWNVIPNAHEPIVDKNDFETVKGLLNQDTRTSPAKDTVYPLSGLVTCGDCGNSMVRKKSGRYHYYVCGTSKKGKGCTSHCCTQHKLENAVLEAIKQQIICILDIEQSLAYAQSLPLRQHHALQLNAKIVDREKEIRINEKFKQSLYEDYKSGMIAKEDLIEFDKDYAEHIAGLKQAVVRLREETELFLMDHASCRNGIEQFKRYREVTNLSRELAVHLIERIVVFEGSRVSIRFRYHDRVEMSSELFSGEAGLRDRSCRVGVWHGKG